MSRGYPDNLESWLEWRSREDYQQFGKYDLLPYREVKDKYSADRKLWSQAHKLADELLDAEPVGVIADKPAVALEELEKKWYGVPEHLEKDKIVTITKDGKAAFYLVNWDVMADLLHQAGEQAKVPVLAEPPPEDEPDEPLTHDVLISLGFFKSTSANQVFRDAISRDQKMFVETVTSYAKVGLSVLLVYLGAKGFRLCLEKGYGNFWPHMIKTKHQLLDIFDALDHDYCLEPTGGADDTVPPT